MRWRAYLGLSLALFSMLVLGTSSAQAAWVAYNDAVHAGSTGNVTNYSGYMADGGGFETPSGQLVDYATGNVLPVTATLSGSNISGSISGPANSGTDADDVFNGKLNLGDWSVSYNSSSIGWYYEVTFTGLTPGASYEFVTTANRNNISYAGDGSTSRWTKFSIIGADTYTNASSTGVVEITSDVVRMNTGYNTVNGYVVRWTGITAADGSFTVRSENIGTGGPGEANKSYGMEGFMLAEVPEPASLLLLSMGGPMLMKRRQH